MVLNFDYISDIRTDAIDYIPGVQSIEPKDMMSYLQETDTTSVCHQTIFKAFKVARGADFVICNTLEELEFSTISALQAQMPFYAIGPIFPSGFPKSIVSTTFGLSRIAPNGSTISPKARSCMSHSVATPMLLIVT